MINRRTMLLGTATLLAGCGTSGGGGGTVVAPQNPTPTPTPVTVPPQTIKPDDARLSFHGFAQVQERSATRFRGARPEDGQLFGFFTPGGVMSFTTTATSIDIEVTFNGTIDGKTVTGFEGFYDPYFADVLIDGVLLGSIRGDTTNPGAVLASLALSGLATTAKLVELIWPYERPMDFNSVRLNGVATLSAAAIPARRIVCGGDSITMGMSAVHPSDAWPVRLARSLGGALINTGYAGRQAIGADGSRDGALGGAVGTYLIGFNDYQNGQKTGQTLAQFGTAIREYITGWFAASTVAGARLYMVSPIYNPLGLANPTFSLQQYRDVIRDECLAYRAANSTALLQFVDGPTLCVNAPDRLNDGTHPADLGHAEIATNLRTIIGAI